MKLTSARAPWDRYASGFAADLRQCSDWGSRRSVGWGTRERRDWRFGWLGSKPAHFGVHRVPDVEVKPWFQPFSTVKWPLTLNQFIEKGLVWKWNTPQSGHFMPFPQKSDNQWIWGVFPTTFSGTEPNVTLLVSYTRTAISRLSPWQRLLWFAVLDLQLVSYLNHGCLVALCQCYPYTVYHPKKQQTIDLSLYGCLKMVRTLNMAT